MRSSTDSSDISDADNETSVRHYLNKRFHLFFNQHGRHVMTSAKKLSGGLTNRSFLVRTNSNEYVVRIPGKGSEQYIDRAKESNDTNIAFTAGTTPGIAYDEKNGFKITYFLNDPLPMNSGLLKNNEHLKKVALVLKKLHGTQSFANSVHVFERNRKMLETLRAHQAALPEHYHQLTEQIDVIEHLIGQMRVKKVPCHNDTTPGNFILSHGDMKMIDFEYGGNNDPAYDLACLSIEGQFNHEQDKLLLETYCGRQIDPDLQQRFTLYKPVVEYWTVLWCLVQLNNANVLGRPNEIKEMEQERYAHCVNLLASDEIQREIARASTTRLLRP